MQAKLRLKFHLVFALLAITLLAINPVGLSGQSSSVGVTRSAPTPGELRATHAFEAAKKLGTPDLYAYLRNMPKGGDLHMHISGAVYAETFAKEAAGQGLCIDPVGIKFVPPVTGDDAPCGKGNVLAGEAFKDQKFYDKFIDTASMRSFVPYAGVSGHDWFFAAFRHFDGIHNTLAEWLDEVATRAAAQNEQYLEIMASPGLRNAAMLGASIIWPADAESSVSREELAALRAKLLAAGLRLGVSTARKDMDDIEAAKSAMEHCADRPVAPSPCSVKMHYLSSVGRSAAPAQVFTSALIGFELANADPRFVGVNILAPEDGKVSMKDYHLHMQIFDYLHSIYPKVHLSLHAGELAPGLVPPEGLRFHIREAVELGHAERIGHGVDVLYEDDAPGLMKEMADKHIMVEINLTSNDVILGVKGADHPLSGYRNAHVPVALSTDDEGVSRIDITHEYVKGAEEQGLGYLDLKEMARTSLEHAFLYGNSLWVAPDDFRRRKAECAAPIAAMSVPNAACSAFLKDNEKAAEQWELERRFAAFEAAVH